MPYSRIREAPESSSAATLRAVVAALKDAWHVPQQGTTTEKRLAQLASRLPEPLVKKLIAREVQQRALDANLARYVKTEGLARQTVAHYEHIEGKIGYPAILIGAPNGGVAYLAALLGAPFLPAYFLLSFAHRSHPDDVSAYERRGSELIAPILSQNPDLLAVNHYDPVHDRFLVEEVNHIRLKLLTLPTAYQSFIQRHLAPGGVIFYVDNEFSWRQYRISDRHWFQVGGLGGFTDEEFLQGSPVLDEWLAQQKSNHRGGWRLPHLDDQLQETRESEWGSLPPFRESVKEFAEAHEYEFRALHGYHPEDFSALAYTAYLWESRLHDRMINGLLVECFSQINPTAALRADLLPLWLPFNTQDSLEFFTRMTPMIPKNLPVVISLLANFTKTPDLPLALAWERIASRIGPVHWIGVHPERYPMDLASIFDYATDLQKWVQEHPGESPRSHLAPEDLLSMIQNLNRHGSKLFTYLLSEEEEDEALAPLEEPPPMTA